MEKEGISKTKTANHVKQRSKKRRKLKRSRRFHKHEVEEEVKCASSASDSDESLGTFCDRYERKQKTKKDVNPNPSVSAQEDTPLSSSLFQDPLMKDFKSYVATKNKLKRKWGMSTVNFLMDLHDQKRKRKFCMTCNEEFSNRYFARHTCKKKPIHDQTSASSDQDVQTTNLSDTPSTSRATVDCFMETEETEACAASDLERNELSSDTESDCEGTVIDDELLEMIIQSSEGESTSDIETEDQETFATCSRKKTLLQHNICKRPNNKVNQTNKANKTTNQQDCHRRNCCCNIQCCYRES
uniref:Uncharacterized protein n=1 Tax=Magallana gigas TaxID=29159 RepID=A0A8W8ML76_MAGGI